MASGFFDGFTDERIDVGGVELRVRHGGDGPAVLLLHGHPRTGATWHRVAPQLRAAGYTVICPDLRGYGASSKPATTSDHAPYSKRAMAADLCVLTRTLGHEQVFVAGHDWGSYVALRMALDAPDLVARLAVLDSVPISEALERCNARLATAWWHWFFFAQPDVPERVILADPDAWYRGSAAAMGEDSFAEFRRAIDDPATVRAMLEDYRAGLGIDRQHEDADRAAGRRLDCPLLVLWSSDDDMGYLSDDPLSVWQPRATDLTGGPITSGHHMAEEAPDQLATALCGFFGDQRQPAT